MQEIEVKVYTDGACSIQGFGNYSPGGWGALIMCKDEAKKLSGCKRTTNAPEMELLGFINGLEEGINMALNEYADNDEVSAVKVHIYCDSAYVVNSVIKGWVKNWENNGWRTVQRKKVKNIGLWKEYLEIDYWAKAVNAVLKCNLTVCVHKVKGHSGDPFNEIVDEIAVAAKEGVIRNMKKDPRCKW